MFNSDHWVLLTQSLARLNEATFGGQATFQEMFEKILAKKGLSLKDMEKSRVYTFHVAIKNLSLLPIEDD